MAAATTVTTTATICLYAYTPAFLHACTSPPPAAAPLPLLLLLLLSFSSFFPPFPSSSLSSSSSPSSPSACPHPHPTSAPSSTIPSLHPSSRIRAFLVFFRLVYGLQDPPTRLPSTTSLSSFLPSFFFFFAFLARKFIAENFPVSPAARVQQDLPDRAETTELTRVLRICDRVLLNSRLFLPPFVSSY